jgi:hypothetical protein
METAQIQTNEQIKWDRSTMECFSIIKKGVSIDILTALMNFEDIMLSERG